MEHHIRRALQEKGHHPSYDVGWVRASSQQQKQFVVGHVVECAVQVQQGDARPPAPVQVLSRPIRAHIDRVVSLVPRPIGEVEESGKDVFRPASTMRSATLATTEAREMGR